MYGVLYVKVLLKWLYCALGFNVFILNKIWNGVGVHFNKCADSLSFLSILFSIMTQELQLILSYFIPFKACLLCMFLQVICTHIVFKDSHCKTISLIPNLHKNFIVNASDLGTVVFHPELLISLWHCIPFTIPSPSLSMVLFSGDF